MFESLKKKLMGFLGKEEKSKKTKQKKEKKTQKPVKKTGKSKKNETTKVKGKTQSTQEAVQEPLQETPEVIQAQPTEVEEKKSWFSRLTTKLGSTTITEEQFTTLFDELEMTLLENNVALEAVDAIREDLKKQLVGTAIKKDVLEKKIAESLKTALAATLKEAPDLIQTIKEKKGTFTILFFGINGSGKTTSLAKLAHYLTKHNITCVMAAGDTFRAASIEQLETHAQRIKVPIVKSTYGGDPAAVAFDAKKYAEKNHRKVVLIDTAGRMYTRDNLMKEMEKIVRVAQPDLKLFVGESITGNDATEQARMFNDTAGIDGIILTKADVDEKGGTALSVSQVTGKPIYFLGTGQTYDDFKPFKKADVLKQLGLD